MDELRGRTVVVTGASRGIGRAIALACAREGATIGINFLSGREAAAALAEDLRSRFDARAVLLPFDVRDPGALRRACEPMLEGDGRIDGWVNNAAVNRPGLLLSQTDEMIREQIEINLIGAFHGCRFAIEEMLRRGGGSIVNIGSVANRRPAPGQSVYAAAKGAVAAMTRALAVEVGRKRIRVNCVEPGPVETDMSRGAMELAGERIRERVPLRRAGEAGEVAELVAFLLSERASYLNGGVFPADGGYHIA